MSAIENPFCPYVGRSKGLGKQHTHCLAQQAAEAAAW